MLHIVLYKLTSLVVYILRDNAHFCTGPQVIVLWLLLLPF